MKSILTGVLYLLILPLLAQQPDAPKGNGRISGTVIDNSNKQPVEFATVALTDPATGKAVDGAICDDKGKFTIKQVANGNFNVVISFIGYETKTVPVTLTDARHDIQLGTVSLGTEAKLLGEVVVEGEKSVVEERVDRTVYNAELDATSKGGDATDVLRRVPMLTVDLDGNVSLRGNQNLKVLINNKPSSIMAAGVADALKQIPADQIKSVEVITSPSARYDAEGSSGIINIILKKNTLQGLTLNLNGNAGYRGAHLGVNGAYRKGKTGLSLGGHGRANYNQEGSFDNQQFTLDQGTGDVTLNSQGADTRSNGVFGRYNFGWDYDINDKNFITTSVRYGVRSGTNWQDGLLTENFLNGVFQSSSLRNVESVDNSHTVDVDFSFTHLYDKPQRELSLLALYSNNDRRNDFVNQILDVNTLDPLNRFKNDNDSYNRELTFQVDYQTPIGRNQLVEVGAKTIMRRAFSDYAYYTAGSPGEDYQKSTNTNLTNNLDYDQNVAAGYLSYTLTQGKYSFKAGARYEYTEINAFTQTEESIDIPSYSLIVPSVNASRKIGKVSTVKASYNRRIQRPGIQFLNPNINAANPLNVRIGNPELDPEYTNNYELSYSTMIKSSSINLTGFVRNTNDAIQAIRDVVGDTIRTTYQNIGTQNAFGGSLHVGININKKLSLNGGSDFYYAMISNNDPNPLYAASNEGWVVNGRIFGSYTLGKGWALQFFSFIRGREVELQGTQGAFYNYSMGFRKEFANKRGSLGLNVENFASPEISIKNTLESPIIRQESTSVRKILSFGVNFGYRIGKMTTEPRQRRKRSINNDDLKDGGGDNQGGDNNQQMGPGQNQQQNGRNGVNPGSQQQQKPGDKKKDDKKKKDGN
jgi:outer membrane receptor protein involved in Fe transport